MIIQELIFKKRAYNLYVDRMRKGGYRKSEIVAFGDFKLFHFNGDQVVKNQLINRLKELYPFNS